MKTKVGIAVLIGVFCLLIVGYGSYRKGYSDAASRAAVERAAEYGHDWNGDPSVEHSASYSLGYTRGHGASYAETRQKDFVECGEKLAELAVKTGNAKIAARLVEGGFVAPSQLEAAARHRER